MGAKDKTIAKTHNWKSWVELLNPGAVCCDRPRKRLALFAIAVFLLLYVYYLYRTRVNFLLIDILFNLRFSLQGSGEVYSPIFLPCVS